MKGRWEKREGGGEGGYMWMRGMWKKGERYVEEDGGGRVYVGERYVEEEEAGYM